MTEDACLLNVEQRRLVETTIADHCRVRGWTLYAVNCRSNHVHVIVATNRHPKEAREQFKAWCTRRLKAMEQESRRRFLGPAEIDEDETIRENWWAERGSASTSTTRKGWRRSSITFSTGRTVPLTRRASEGGSQPDPSLARRVSMRALKPWPPPTNPTR